MATAGGAAWLDEQRSASKQVADHRWQSPACVQIRSGTGTHKWLPFMTPANNTIQTFMGSSRQNIFSVKAVTEMALTEYSLFLFQVASSFFEQKYLFCIKQQKRYSRFNKEMYKAIFRSD